MTELLPGVDGLGALTVFVTDVDAEADFCARVLGLPELYRDEQSVVFGLGATAVNLLRADHAQELVAPAASHAVGAPAQMVLTLWVFDADAACAELRQRGAELLNGPLDRPWGKRTAAFSSPSGLIWEVAQDL